MSPAIIFSRRQAVAVCCAFFAATALHAAPPAAPQVTTSANNIKQLRFDWDIVPQSNKYEFWFRANDAASWVKHSESVPWRPRAIDNIAAHLLDWDEARYQVKACNPSGCTATPNIAVDDLMFDSIGYFKASRVHNRAQFGLVMAISEDGNTLAAFTASEAAPEFPQSAVYVFAKVDGRWRQQARIFPASSIPDWNNVGLTFNFQAQLSLSADGNVLVAGMPFRKELFEAPGVTVYRRTGGTWTQEYQLMELPTVTGHFGGFHAEVSDSGNRILYRQNFDFPFELINHSSAGWQRQSIPQPISGGPLMGGLCLTARLSGDGESIAFACTEPFGLQSDTAYVSRAPDWGFTAVIPNLFPQFHFVNQLAIDSTGSTVVATSFANGNLPEPERLHQVRVFRAPQAGSSEWIPAPIIFPSSWTQSGDAQFATDIALSSDGGWLAILDPGDTGAGMGVLSPPLEPGSEATGVTYVYDLRAPEPRLRRLLKPNNPIPAGGLAFGEVDFANNGQTLAVSEPYEPGNACCIDGDRNAGTRLRTGAIWLY